jgi:hypothetical protein
MKKSPRAGTLRTGATGLELAKDTPSRSASSAATVSTHWRPRGLCRIGVSSWPGRPTPDRQ